MLLSVTAETAKTRELTASVDGQDYVGREYIGSAPKPGTEGYGEDISGEDYPQAYLVIQPPGSVTRPHFHQTNQYQLFVGGSGKVGKIRTDPVTVQFAAANTPYGPIVAEDEGISYFTLRQRWDSGAKYLPAMRDLLVRGHQRQRIGVAASTDDRLPSGQGELTQVLIEPEADGLAATRYLLAPGSSTHTPDGSHAGGQYHVVIAGSLLRGDQELGLLSVEFTSPSEGAVELCAGATGLDVVVLRFPRG